MGVTFRSDMKVELVDFMGGDGRVVQAARTSTLGAAASQQKESAGLINFLVRERHEVPIEHSVFTFRIEAPIFVTRQILKHRITSISEESGRYREMDGEFYIPDMNRPLSQVGRTGDYNMVQFDYSEDVDYALAEMQYACRSAWLSYTTLLNDGVAKEVARMVLPVNLYSSMYLTINGRSLMNFLSLRNEHHAQWEIREVAKQMNDIFRDMMPLTYNAWEKSRETDDLADIRQAWLDYLDDENNIDTRDFAQAVEDILARRS